MSTEDGTLTFPRAADTGNVLGIQLGRLILGDGQIVRLWMTPSGLHIAVPSASPNVHIMDNVPLRYSTLGKAPE